MDYNDTKYRFMML